MHGTPFILGPDEAAALAALRQMAAMRPVDMPPLMERLKTRKGKLAHMAAMTAQTVELPFGYTVTFSIELNHPGGRMARHLSMASPHHGRVPRPEALWMVAEHLGFTGAPGIDKAEENLKLCAAVWFEDLTQGKAVNVVQFIEAAEGGRA